MLKAKSKINTKIFIVIYVAWITLWIFYYLIPVTY
jgi:hypothetical protein